MQVPQEIRGFFQALTKRLRDEGEKEKPAKKAPVDVRLEALAAIREHLRQVGVALAAGGTALMAGLGWVNLHNVFPAPAVHHDRVILLAAVGSIAALIGIGWLVQMIFSAQRRIPVSSDPHLGPLGLSPLEVETRDRAFSSVAEEHGAPAGSGPAGLRELERQAWQAARDAETTTDPVLKAQLEAKSARLRAAVREAIVGAGLLILEQRAAHVFRSLDAKIAYVLVAVGIVLAYGAADYSKGQRDLIALRKSCAEALAAGVKDPCASVVAFEPRPADTTDGAEAAAVPLVEVSVPPLGRRCRAVVRVDGERVNATKAGPVKLTLFDRSESCGVRVAGGGLSLESGRQHMGKTTHEVQLRRISYRVVVLQPASGTPPVRERDVDPLVAGR